VVLKRAASVKPYYKWLKRSIFTFPLIVALALIILTILQIHGSSIGIYHNILYTSKTPDHSLVYGHPQAIRSDEWKVGSPWTVLQAKSGFPAFNDRLGSGRDVVTVPDIPAKDWVTIFRPHNWSFFIMPFENAFAFRWWFGLALLMVASYFFALRVVNGNKKVSILLSIAFSLSPFLIWWYQSTLFIPLAYSLIIMIIGMRVIGQENIRGVKSKKVSNALYVLALSYLVASFILYIYAPFLIAFSIVACAFLIGYLFDQVSAKKLKLAPILKRLGLFAIALITAGLVVLSFVIEHRDTIAAISNSEYPGKRTVASGELPYSPLFPLFGSFLMPILEDTAHATHYYTNQSEASNYILLLPFLILPSIAIQFYEYRKRRKISFALLAINITAVLLIVRLTIPGGDSIYRFMLLDRVPNYRLIAGFGLVGFLQLLYTIRLLGMTKLARNIIVKGSLIYGAAVFVALVAFGKYFVMDQFPKFLSNNLELVVLALIFSAIIVFFLTKRFLLASSLLLALTLFSTFRILPLYKGADFFYDSRIVKTMESVSDPHDKWVVLDDQNFQQLPAIAGRGSVGGAQFYTDLNFWHQIDNDGHLEYVYNRQAHALFLSNTLKADPAKKYNVYTVNDKLELVKVNLFKVKFTCSKFTYDNIDFVLTLSEIDKECTQLIDKVRYPKQTFYIYKVLSPTR
jgi:hypothetical protein